MSDLFFEQLGMPKPDMNLNVGSGPHGQQTANIMMRFEPLLQEHRPNLVMVFGDVNSTIAAALCAAKMGIKVAHVEAGLRSGDRSMPEEVNRVLTDHISDYLFVTEQSGIKNLQREGVAEEKIHFVGNVMVDTLLKHLPHARQLKVSPNYGLQENQYGVLTLHRPSNVDDPHKLAEIIDAIDVVASHLPIIFPCHPRTRQHFEDALRSNPGGVPLRTRRNPEAIKLVDPLGYLEFLSLTSSARLVLTDSGGIQEETTVLGIPCLTLRDNTERPVTIHEGTNVLVGTRRDVIIAAAKKALETGRTTGKVPELWDGKAAQRIAAQLVSAEQCSES